MKALIVDDEHKSRETLHHLLTLYCPEVHFCATSAGFSEGYTLYTEFQPDLVFLDIQLHATEGNGVDFARLIERADCAVVFTTGFSEFAVEAFRLKAVDYLLKPVRIDQLQEAVRKAAFFLKRVAPPQTAFHIPTKDGVQLIRQQDILRCEADGSYTHLYLQPGGERVTASVNIGKILAQLNRDFMRIHKSHIVNRQFITGYTKGESLFVKMSDRSEVPVSRNQREPFFDWLQ